MTQLAAYELTARQLAAYNLAARCSCPAHRDEASKVPQPPGRQRATGAGVFFVTLPADKCCTQFYKLWSAPGADTELLWDVFLQGAKGFDLRQPCS